MGYYFIILIIFICIIILNIIFKVLPSVIKKQTKPKETYSKISHLKIQNISTINQINEIQIEEDSTKSIHKNEKSESLPVQLKETQSYKLKETSEINISKDQSSISMYNRLNKLPPLKKAVILSEILGNPKGLS